MVATRRDEGRGRRQLEATEGGRVGGEWEADGGDREREATWRHREWGGGEQRYGEIEGGGGDNERWRKSRQILVMDILSYMLTKLKKMVELQVSILMMTIIKRRTLT
ncbi:unnamed protein product [Linum trigynum]|uniref:Uncharacterized protein n=1 Tax=Linum trigynum TaxID=586398 RepID=A0AAV2GQF4_9ROSI